MSNQGVTNLWDSLNYSITPVYFKGVPYDYFNSNIPDSITYPTKYKITYVIELHAYLNEVCQSNYHIVFVENILIIKLPKDKKDKILLHLSKNCRLSFDLRVFTDTESDINFRKLFGEDITKIRFKIEHRK